MRARRRARARAAARGEKALRAQYFPPSFYFFCHVLKHALATTEPFPSSLAFAALPAATGRHWPTLTRSWPGARTCATRAGTQRRRRSNTPSARAPRPRRGRPAPSSAPTRARNPARHGRATAGKRARACARKVGQSHCQPVQNKVSSWRMPADKLSVMRRVPPRERAEIILSRRCRGVPQAVPLVPRSAARCSRGSSAPYASCGPPPTRRPPPRMISGNRQRRGALAKNLQRKTPGRKRVDRTPRPRFRPQSQQRRAPWKQRADCPAPSTGAAREDPLTLASLSLLPPSTLSSARAWTAGGSAGPHVGACAWTRVFVPSQSSLPSSRR